LFEGVRRNRAEIAREISRDRGGEQTRFDVKSLRAERHGKHRTACETHHAGNYVPMRVRISSTRSIDPVI
jgi:hypothetical protein